MSAAKTCMHPKIGDDEPPPPSALKPIQSAKKFSPMAKKRASSSEEPAYLRNDPGLACLTSQLGRINAQIRYHEQFKQSFADAEEQCIRDLEAASLAKSLASSSLNDSDQGRKYVSSESNSMTTASAYHDVTSKLNQWVKHW